MLLYVFYFVQPQHTKSNFVQPQQTKSKSTYNIEIAVYRGGSRTAATSKMERFVIIVNGWKPLTIIAKRSILDVAVVLDPPLVYLLGCIQCS